ncbi:hypothetical protein LP414_27345 [Polaromonas sp. P1(28)-13]|nr:hypothetical protein LP414_27345 [Polaromonas sp. P1(28)-13]
MSKIIRDFGHDPSKTDYDFKTRLDIQEEVLKQVDAIYDCVPAGVDAIADRTPLDMLGYTMAEAIGENVLPEDQNRFAAYVQRCFDVTNKRFSAVVLLQPGIPLIPGRDGKAVANLAYMEHLNSLILGLTVDPRLKTSHFYIQRHQLSVEERLGALEGAARRITMIAHQALGEYMTAGGLLQ